MVVSNMNDPAALTRELHITMRDGSSYHTGIHIPGDPTEEDVFEGLVQAADDGQAEAQFEVGVRCKDGRGCVRNDEKAAKYFLDAANQGHTDAQMYMHMCYALGEGVQQDGANALLWCDRAADQGSPEAQHVSGMTRHGYPGYIANVPADVLRGKQLISAAARQGFQQAIDALKHIGWCAWCGAQVDVGQLFPDARCHLCRAQLLAEAEAAATDEAAAVSAVFPGVPVTVHVGFVYE
jgi:TPR repeat protein